MYSKRHQKRLIKKEINEIINSHNIIINDEIICDEVDEFICDEVVENIVDENFSAENISDRQGNLISDIKQWAVHNSITRVAFDSLLKVLNKWHIQVPTSSESLTVRHEAIIRTVSPGTYLHLGIKNKLRRLSTVIENMNTVVLDIGVDGLPLFKSSAQSLWPILGKLVPQLNTEVLLFGVYLGNKKPSDVNDYIQDFVEELSDLMANGISINGKVIKIQIRAFICDSPAKAFLCQIIGHNALQGCTRCYQVGKRMNNRTVYSTSKGLPRTNIDFTLRTGEKYHKPSINGRYLLEEAGIQMVTQFPLDAMHLIDLGVVKKMLICLLNGKFNYKKLSKIDKENLSKKMLRLKDFIPIEFVRKPRTFEEIKRWKSVEFRQFILYTGILVLKKSIDHNVYEHFLLLHAAYRILLTEKKYKSNINVVNDILQYFVELFPVVYNQDTVSSNVHSLLHITECVEELGFLNTFTAYRFENHMQKIKKYVKKPTKILEQINNKDQDCEVIKKEKKIGVKINKFGEIIAVLSDRYTLKVKLPDNIVFCGESPFQIVRFAQEGDEVFFVGRRFTNCTNFFERPINSQTDLGIFTANKTPILNEEMFNIKLIEYKLVYFPLNDNEYLFIPLLHTI